MLSDFSFSPQVVDSEANDGDVVTFPLTLDVSVRDQEEDLDRVFYTVQSPVAGRDPVASGSLQRSGEDRYGVTDEVSLPRGDIGVYTVIVYAVDAEGSMSNTVRGNLKFTGTAEPPVIEDVVAEPEIVRPPTELRMIAIVSDPDGLANVAGVIGTAPNGFEFNMSDDGRTLGDEEAGDGRFTATFDVQAASPGTQQFSFVAIDKTGLESEVFTKDVVVE